MVRFKNRYLLCELDLERRGDRARLGEGRDVVVAIRDSILTTFGFIGEAQMCGPSFALKWWSAPLLLMIVRVSREYAREVWMATTLVTQVHVGSGSAPGPSRMFNPGKGFHSVKLRISVRHMAGTIRSCQSAAASRVKEIWLDQNPLTHTTEQMQQDGWFSSKASSSKGMIVDRATVTQQALSQIQRLEP
mmetsp:Transcript_645/g.1334  ORF Transcript_645/g.1334 Transcript_645/m.1334 type:complete len:190 (-) Transcript_645:697-1266(-)